MRETACVMATARQRLAGRPAEPARNEAVVPTCLGG